MPGELLSESSDIADAHAEQLLGLLKELTGITIPLQKKLMVLFRLRKRLAELNNPPLPEYVLRVRRDRSERQMFVNLLTTNETSFFRTPRIWQYSTEDYLPDFHRSRSSDMLRVWSAAASTGEEACSIAMVCHNAQLRHSSFRYQVLATDVDTDVLLKAESGCFSARNIDKLRTTHPDMFDRHFTDSPSGAHEVNAQLRRNIRFTTHNLMERPQFSAPQDIIFLRNVLIYFQEAEQMKILQQLIPAMAADAILILGESESISALDLPFTFLQPQIYRKAA